MSFPSLSTEVKDEKYHRAFAEQIAQNSITSSWATSFRIKQECIKFFNSGSTGEMAGFVQKAQDGTDLPAMWLSISSLKSKIENLIGELETRGSEIRVRALSKEAVSRKKEEKEKRRVARRLQPTAQFAEEKSGLPLQDQSEIPQTERELDEWVDLKYKDKLELVYEMGLKKIADKNRYPDKRKAGFRDVWITNGVFVRNDMVRGFPTFTKIDPLCMIFDPNSTDDELSDSTYFGEPYYMGLADAAEKFNLSKEEIEQSQGQYNSQFGTGAAQAPLTTSADNFFGAVPQDILPWYSNLNNAPRVLVVRTCWKDYKVDRYKSETNDTYNSTYIQPLKPGEGAKVNKKRKTEVLSEKMTCWRGCTLIGGTIIKEWGELPNQPRDIETIEETLPPYTCWVPNYLMGQSVSKTEQLVKLELLRDMAMYNLQLAMNRAGAKGFIYDMALMPEGWNLDKVAGYLKTAGIAAVNTKEYQVMQGGMNVITPIDLSISDGVRNYVEIMNFIDTQENIIMGSSPERQGVIPAASQAVGVTDAAILQSSMTTKPYFVGYERFWSRVMSQQAKLLRISVANKPEMWDSILGEAGVDFLRDNIDVSLESVGVIVEALLPLLQDRSKFEGLVTMMVQSGGLEPQDAIDILLDPDIRQANRKLQRKVTLRKMLEAQHEQAMQQQQQEMDQRLDAQNTQRQQIAQQGEFGLQQLKNKGTMDKTAVVSNTKLNSDKINALAKK